MIKKKIAYVGRYISRRRKKMRTLRLPKLTEKRITELLKEAKVRQLFDAEWYSQRTGNIFSSEIAAFEDYLHKSTFANVNPSPNFDTETYFRMNLDVYHASVSPLQHYLEFGAAEGRSCPPAIDRWCPKQRVDSDNKLTKSAKKLNLAIALHIFYPDYIERFAKALRHFPIDFDVYLTLTDKSMEQLALDTFKGLKSCRKVELRVVPNRGRNFGPLLVEFARDLLPYDLVCHLHSKKSLFSGREQTQWSDYLTEYLLRDRHAVVGALNAFARNDEVGVYYPVSFWLLPSWVNHWTRNRGHARVWLDKVGELDLSQDFINYPVGGMFWSRPAAIRELLEQDYTYDQFPAEPLPNDGSMLHALERLIGLLAERNGYRQLYYFPSQGCFTTDGGYRFLHYRNRSAHAFEQLNNHKLISFDLFDTLVRRRYQVADYAKLKLGQKLVKQGMVGDAHEFVALRNEAEFELRKERKFKGDVRIDEIYERLTRLLGLDAGLAEELENTEFAYDYEMLEAKQEMVDIFNHLHDHNRELWIVTDTYYREIQIESIIRKAGITVPYRLFVSSETGKRKDNGTMWRELKKRIGQRSYVHVGDNVVSDSQVPGDLGLATFHILNPVDKWQALGFKQVLTDQSALNEAEILKWGPLICNAGRSPFIGE